VIDDKLLLESDLENAQLLYIMTHFETSIGVTSPDFRVKDIFSYQDNRLSVTCDYQSLLDYFYTQID